MTRFRAVTMTEIFYNLFPTVGTTIPKEEVIERVGFKGKDPYDELKTYCKYFRNSKHIKEEHRINVSLRNGNCVRIG